MTFALIFIAIMTIVIALQIHGVGCLVSTNNLILNKMATDLTEIIAKVEAIENVGDASNALLLHLKGLLDAAGTDPVKLKELSDRLGAQTQEMSDAIAANTPAE